MYAVLARVALTKIRYPPERPGGRAGLAAPVAMHAPTSPREEKNPSASFPERLRHTVRPIIGRLLAGLLRRTRTQ